MSLLSPVQLKVYFINEFYFALREDYVPSDDYNTSIDILDLGIDVTAARHEDNPRAWRFRLDIELNTKEPKYPYSFHVVMDGFFDVLQGHPDDKVELLVKVNGPSLLYSSIRELLVTMTARSVHPPIFLPTINFFELLKNNIEEKKQVGTAKEPALENSVEPEKPGKGKKKPSKAKTEK